MGGGRIGAGAAAAASNGASGPGRPVFNKVWHGIALECEWWADDGVCAVFGVSDVGEGTLRCLLLLRGSLRRRAARCATLLAKAVEEAATGPARVCSDGVGLLTQGKCKIQPSECEFSGTA